MLFIGIMFLMKNVIDIVKGIHETRMAKKKQEEILEAIFDGYEALSEDVWDKMEIIVYEKGTIEADPEPLKFGD